MSVRTKARDLVVGDVVLVAHVTIGRMSLFNDATGEFVRSREAWEEERLIVALEETTEDGYPKDWVSADEWGPQPVIVVTALGDSDRERTSHYSPDDEVRVKDPNA